MNLKQAQYMKAIADCGTITAATKLLYVSQPSLSQMLRQIEDELGLPIFDRSVSPFVPTYAGEKYLEAVEKFLETQQQLDDQIAEMKQEKSGRIRFCISVSRGIQILPKVLPSFQKEYPNVRFELIECGSAGMETLLLERKTDLALAAIEPASRAVEYDLLEMEFNGILAGKDSHIAKRFVNGDKVSLWDAREDFFVSLTKEHSSRVLQDYMFQKNGFKPKIFLETDSLEIGRRVASEAGGCMILPSAYMDEYVHHVNACFFPFVDFDNNRHFYACTRKGEYLPQYTKDFIEMIKKTLKELHSTPYYD